MSDEPPDDFEVTPEYMAQMRSRDDRVAILMESIDVERDMTSNPTIVALQRAVKSGFDFAVAELCETSPGDEREVSRLLVNIKTYVYMRKIFEAILSRGKDAERSLREQDGIG